MKKNTSVEKILREDPDSSKMIIEAMGSMRSADHAPNDPQKVFAYLHSVSQYVTNFFKNPNANPDIFGPPGPPKSVKLDKNDLNSFTMRAVNFISDNWDRLQSQEVLQGNIKKELQSESGMQMLQQKISQKLEILKGHMGQDHKSITAHMPGINPPVSKEGAKGAAIGFLKGGKIGAVKGYITGAAKEMAKKRREVQRNESLDTRENLGERFNGMQQADSSPEMKMH